MENKHTRHSWFALVLAAAASSVSVACGPTGGAGQKMGSNGSSSGAASSGSGSGSSVSGTGSSGSGAASSGSSSGSAGSGSGGTGADGSAPLSVQGLFLDRIFATGTVVYDAQGGLHVAGSGSKGLRYGECASQCGVATNWSYADVVVADDNFYSNHASFLDLAVDGQGHPRVVVSGVLPTTSGISSGTPTTRYVECNADCGNASSWSAVEISKMVVSGDQFFDVSPQGVAAFGYWDPQRGVVYSSCSSGCTTAGNWQEAIAMPPPAANVTASSIALAFDAAGNPHIVADFVNGTHFWYAECGGNCTSTSGWTAIPVGSQVTIVGTGRHFAVDPQGRPTVLALQMNTPGYYVCNGNCAASASNWQGPFPPKGAWSWLQVDAQNNPRAAVAGSSPPNLADPNYWACTAGCTSASPTWQDIDLAYADLNAADPAATNGDAWGKYESSGRVTLSLDRSGNAAFTTDAELWFMYNSVAAGTSPDGSGVFLWLVPAVADSAGSASGSSSGSGGSGSSSGTGSGTGDAGSGGLSNFEGAAWTGTLTETVSCGDAGTSTGAPSESFDLVPTASGFSFTDKNGCTLDFTVSGSTATLSNAPVVCSVSTDAGSIREQFTSVTLTSTDGHHLSVDVQGSVTSTARSCLVAESGMLTR